MMSFFKVYKLFFVFLCFALFSCSKDEPEEKKSDKAEITSWQFSKKEASISGKDISITLPYQTDVKKLTAEVEISEKAKISPDPSKARDYTNPINFTVTAEDGKTKNTYMVTVKVEKSNEAEITSFKLSSKETTINGSDISINLPYGTDVKKLTGDVEISKGATISPNPNRTLNYTNPVKFTVTAEDGKTKKTYTVRVILGQNVKAEISSWKFLNKEATIKGTDISITLPYGTDITNLRATVEISARARINPDPNIARDYTNSLNFVVVAEDGKTIKTYTVKVIVAKNTEAEITQWMLSSNMAIINGNNISITFPYLTDIKNLTASAKISAGATISPDPKTARDYTKPVNFTVTAQDGKTTKTYTVIVTVAQNKDAEITSWRFLRNTATINEISISITLPYGTDITNLRATVTKSAGATISPDPTQALDYTKPINFLVTSRDGKTKITYTVTVTVEKNKRAEITSFSFLSNRATISGNNISITLPYGTNAGNLAATARISGGATINPNPATVRDYTSTVNFTVTAEDGTTTKRYTVTVTVAKNKAADITSWMFGSNRATINGTNISITLPPGTNARSLTATVRRSAGATISPDPNSVRDYTSPINFVVISEDKTNTKTYTVRVTVARSPEANITSWMFGSNTATINGTNISITLPHLTDVRNLAATVRMSAGATISPDPSIGRNYTSPVNFTVRAQDGRTTKTYTVTVTIEAPLITSWQAGWRDDDAYTATIDHSKAEIKIDVNSADFDTKVTLLDGASITPDPNTITNWVNEVSFTVSKGSNRKVYKVQATVNGRDIIKITNAKATSKTGGSLKSILNVQVKIHTNTGNFNHIDVSSVTDMSYLFHNDDKFQSNNKFNGDISKWDVSNVTNMNNMFRKATSFNKDIGSWNVSNVTNMMYVFYRATSFNQNIGRWNVSNVTDMSSMFHGAKSFNQNIRSWNVSKVAFMSDMFNGATSFNQNIRSWNVSLVKYCDSFSKGATAFTSSNKPGFSCRE